MIPRIAFCSLLLAVLLSFSGCGKEKAEEKEPLPMKEGTGWLSELKDQGEEREKALASEDPEFRELLEKKGWRLARDMRIADSKWLTYLNVTSQDPLSLEDCQMLSRCKSAHVLSLNEAVVTDEGLLAILDGEWPLLESIIVSGEEVTDKGIAALADKKALTFVSLTMTEKVTDAGVAALAALPKLDTLHLFSLKVTGSFTEAFTNHETLRSLQLDWMSGLTNKGVAPIADIPNLGHLKIDMDPPLFGEPVEDALDGGGLMPIVKAGLPPHFELEEDLIDDDLLVALVKNGWLYGPQEGGPNPERLDPKPATAKDVREIVLDGSSVTDEGFKAVLDCTQIENVFISKTAITDETLRRMSDFPKLKYLSLGETQITGAGLAALEKCPIEHVALEKLTLTEDAFKALGKLKGLQELWLAQATYDPAWLKHLEGLTQLKELNLRDAHFNDEAVEVIKTLPALDDLCLNDTELTDAGLKELVKIPQLTSILVDGTKITKAGYDEVKRQYPNKTIYHYRHSQDD